MIVNYGKNWSFTPRSVVRPRDVDELASEVRRAKSVRAMGSRHSWSQAIVTNDTLLSLDRMSRVLEVDTTARFVRVSAGITLHALVAELATRGLALEHLGSIDAQSLAGAMATGTHGTGLAFQCLAAQLEALKLVDGEGRLCEYRKGDPAFDAVAVGLGCHGVVYEMTLRVVPSFRIHASTHTVDWTDLLENLDAYVRGHDHFKFWWLVPSDRVIVYLNDRTDRPRDDSRLERFLRDELLSVAVYRSLLVVGKVDRLRLIPRINEFLTTQAGRPFERTLDSPIGFLTPSPPVHRETEWAFDYRGATDLLVAYRELLARGDHAYNFIQEIRFTQRDRFWMSPAYARDSIWLSMYNIDQSTRWNAQLERFDAFAMAHGGRPHWGKEGRLDATYLAAQYEQHSPFRELMREHDPHGKFVNPWARSIFG